MAALPTEALEDLCEDLADLRHDLGKYITFEVRFVGLDAPTEELRAAVQADVLQTDKRGGKAEPAWSVWARLRPPLPDDDADIATIDAAIKNMSSLSLASADRDGLLAAAALAVSVQASCKRLSQRCAATLDERGG
ncbi:MAG: hypothetical protein ACI8S6_005889 [Myxococcota bacterium]|jgi:hypothetical protein